MTKLKTRMMIGAYAPAMGTATFAGSAQAATSIYGSGSTLIAPYARQAMDCYGNQTQLIFTGPVVQTLPYFNFTGTQSFDCDPENPHTALAHGPVNSGVTFFFDGTGSGTGIKGMVGHSGTYAGDTDPAVGTQVFPTINYGLSDTGLDATGVNGWNNGIGDYASDGLCNDGSTRADPVGTTPNHRSSRPLRGGARNEPSGRFKRREQSAPAVWRADPVPGARSACDDCL